MPLKQKPKINLKRAEALEIGAEIGHGTLERTVEITIGTDIDALMGAEILTEDGKIMLSANDMEKQVVIGTIIAPHGVRGDIRILPQTDHPETIFRAFLFAARRRPFASDHLCPGSIKRMVLMKCRGVENNGRCRTAARQKGFNQTVKICLSLEKANIM